MKATRTGLDTKSKRPGYWDREELEKQKGASSGRWQKPPPNVYPQNKRATPWFRTVSWAEMDQRASTWHKRKGKKSFRVPQVTARKVNRNTASDAYGPPWKAGTTTLGNSGQGKDEHTGLAAGNL